MDQNLLALTAIAPGLVIAGLILWLDKNKESSRNIIGFFFLGMVITIPAYAFQELSYKLGFDVSYQLGTTFLFAFIVVALTEEVMKFVAMRYYLFPKNYFDEPMDGIVYGTMLAMGFATLENVLYSTELGLETAVLRMFTAVPAHAVFGIIMGYFITKAKFEEANRTRNLTLAFAIPFVLHGLFDFCILQPNYDLLRGASLLVLLGGIITSVILIRKARNYSPITNEVVATKMDSTEQIEEKSSSTDTASEATQTTESTVTVKEENSTIETEQTPPTVKEKTNQPRIEIQDPETIKKNLAELENELKDMRENLEDNDAS